MSLSGHVQLFASDTRDTGTSQLHPLGTMGATRDGRVYRYGEAGGADLDPGKLTVAATQVGNHANIAVQAAAAVGASQVTVTLGATAASANDYADGYLAVNDAAGEGIAYLVSGHPAADASADLVVALHEDLEVALTTSSEVSLIKNPMKDAVISATDQADLPVGVPNVTIASGSFGWFQTRGVCGVLADEAVTAGLTVTIGTGVAGAVEALDGAGEPDVGKALQAGVDTEYRVIYLHLE